MRAVDRADLGRLAAAAQRSRLALRKPRENRVYMARQYVGDNYSEDGAAAKIYCNLLSLYTSIVGRKLIANNPRVMLSTMDRSIRPIVSAMEDWANKEIVRIDLANTLQRVVFDALFSIGICKVGLASPADAASVSWNLGAGEPFAQRIDLDDFVYDVHARDFSEAAFLGHRFRVPLRTIKESKLYSKARRELGASDDRLYNLEGDERISMIGRTSLAGEEEFEDMVDLWEFYLPRHRQIVTLHDDNLSGAAADKEDKQYGRALRIAPWIGPDCGPYHILGMGLVPGNAMPKGPMQDLLNLHEAINNLLRKLIWQGKNFKDIMMVAGGAAEDGSRILTTSNGEATLVNDPNNIKNAVWNVPNQQVFQLFVALKELFSWLAGNLEIMGGLSAQSKTAHQDELLNQNSSATISDMQERTVGLASSVIGALCWYWHHDPYKTMRVSHALPGLPEMSVMRNVTAQRRQGVRFEDMDLKVDPYSMPHASPQQRLAGLNQIVQTVIAPMLPLLQQQGIGFNINAYMQKIGKYMDQPDLSDILTMVEPPQQDTPSGGDKPSMPAQTERSYIRRSVGGATAHGKEVGILNEMAKKPATNGTPQGQNA